VLLWRIKYKIYKIYDGELSANFSVIFIFALEKIGVPGQGYISQQGRGESTLQERPDPCMYETVLGGGLLFVTPAFQTPLASWILASNVSILIIITVALNSHPHVEILQVQPWCGILQDNCWLRLREV